MSDSEGSTTTSSSDHDEGWDEWNEGDEQERTKCLLCAEIQANSSDTMLHMQSAHGFDLKQVIISKFTRPDGSVNMYDVIKIVNYIRNQANNTSDATAIIADLETRKWKDEKYLIPVIPGDPMLFSIHSLFDNVDEDPDTEVVSEASHIQASAAAATSASKPMASAATSDIVEEDSKSGVKVSTNVEREIDEGYFGAYSGYWIHEEMLKDRVRTEAYRDFMYKNPAIFKDKIVLDVGCGTGILSMFAARSGAKRVIAVDNSSIIEHAKAIAKENGLDDKILFVRGKAEALSQLPEGITQVDIIISEWMGYCLLYENMLSSVFLTRDRWLAKPTGRIYPDVASLRIVGAQLPEFRKSKLNFWTDDVYGFKMSVMAEAVLREAHVEIISSDCIVTGSKLLTELQLDTLKVESLASIETTFELQLNADKEYIDAFVIYFDIGFVRDAENPITFSTGPHSTPTHWKQTVLLLKQPLTVSRDDAIVGQVVFLQNRESFRDLDIQLRYWRRSSPDTVWEQKYFVT